MRPVFPKPLRPPSPSAPLNLSNQPRSWLYAFWKFCRPHTVIGTSLSVLGLYLLAVHQQGQQLSATNPLPGPGSLLLALLACLAGNIYIVGLNQLTDVAIDQINKPHLPLASGEFSRQQGWTIVGFMGLLALTLAVLGGSFLLATVGVSLAIGTAYSLPPIRLKRFPFWASLCILTVRGAIVNLGLFLHFTQGGSVPLTVWALTGFILVFTFAIAIFKDIPDAEGDRRYHITTLTLKLGQRSVFNLSRWVLSGCYLGMVLVALWLPGVNGALVVVHLLLLGGLWWRSQQVNLADRAAIARFYQFIWKLFFLEYLLFPVICLLWG